MSASMLACVRPGSSAILLQRSPRPLLTRAPLVESVGVLGENVGGRRPDRVAKDDGVRNLHHGCLQVQAEQHVLGLGIGHLLSQEGREGRLAHEGAVDNLAGEHRNVVLQLV